jgi:hypothetical protein
MGVGLGHTSGTKPIKPPVKKKSTYESLVEKVSLERGINPKAIRSVIDKIAYHESDLTMNPKIKQYGGGPGRGLFQFEPDSLKTTYKRANNYFTKRGEKSPFKVEKNYNAAKLPADEQKALALVDMLQRPNFNINNAIQSDEALTKEWGRGWQTTSDPVKMKNFSQHSKMWDDKQEENLNKKIDESLAPARLAWGEQVDKPKFKDGTKGINPPSDKNWLDSYEEGTAGITSDPPKEDSWSISGMIDSAVNYFSGPEEKEEEKYEAPSENSVYSLRKKAEREEKLKLINEGKMLHPKYKYYSDEELAKKEDAQYDRLQKIMDDSVKLKKSFSKPSEDLEKEIEKKSDYTKVGDKALEYLEGEEGNKDFAELSRLHIEESKQRRKDPRLKEMEDKMEIELNKSELLYKERERQGSMSSLKEAVDWTKDYIDSPKYKERLEKERELSNINDDRYSEIAMRKRKGALNALKINAPTSLPGASAFYSPMDHNIQYTPDSYYPPSYSSLMKNDNEYQNENLDTSTHEVSHGSTMANSLLSKGFIDKVSEFKKENKGSDKRNSEYYYTPTEVKARLDASRRLMQKEGINDPFKEDVNDEDIDKLKEIDTGGISDLLKYFTKKQVKWMFNNIAKGDEVPGSNNKNWLENIT